MSDVNANIVVNVNTSEALAQLKALQREIATLHSSISRSSAASVAAQKNLQTNLLNSINATGKFSAQMGIIRTSTESFTHALENNKLSMREYFRYAGASTKSFGRLFKSEFDTIGRVAEERVKKLQTQYISMGRDAKGAMQAMAITPNTLNLKDFSTQTMIAAQKQAVFGQLLKQGSANMLNFGKNTQWAGRQLMVGFTVPLVYFMAAASKAFMNLEKEAVKFKRVYGDMFTTTADTAKALQDVTNIANEFVKYGVAAKDTMAIAADIAAMGKKGADLTNQLTQATKLAILGNIEQQQALDTTISIQNAFGISTEQLASKIDFLNAVENQTVLNIEDLTVAIPKVAPVIKQLGGTVEDAAFFMTAMKEGGIEAAQGANALKSAMGSIINPTKAASNFLAGFGVNIRGIVDANSGNLRATILGVAQSLDTLDPLNRARAIEMMFGKFQFARISTLFQNITKDGSQANKVLGLTQASIEELAILSEREMKTVQDAVGTNFKAAVEKLKISIAPIGKTFLQAITPIAVSIGKIFDKFNNLSDGTKKLIVTIVSLGGILGPLALMTFGLVANGAANIIKLFLIMRNGFLRLGGESRNLGEQLTYFNEEQIQAVTVAASLNQAHTRLTQKFELEATAVAALRNAYVSAAAAARTFAVANPGMMTGKIAGKFANGTTGLPGPAGAGDIIPIMAAPGEAIIPAASAQDPANKPFISAMVRGRKLPGFINGTEGIGLPAEQTVFAHATDKRILQGSNVPEKLRKQGYTRANAYTAFGFDIPKHINSSLIHGNANVREYENALRQPLAVKTMVAKLLESGLQETEAKKIANKIRINLIKSLAELPSDRLIGDRDIYSRTGNAKTGILGGLIRDAKSIGISEGIKNLLSDHAYSPTGKSLVQLNAEKSISEVIAAVEPTVIPKSKRGTTTESSLLKALQKIKALDENLKLPVRVDENGKIVAFERPEISGKTGQFNDKTNLGVLVGNKWEASRNDSSGGGRAVRAKTQLAKTAKNLLEGLTATDLAGREVTQYGKKLADNPGNSFRDAKHLGGVYETLDGGKVFIKAMPDLVTAEAERRATQIAREVSGLQSPEQKLRVIKDPFTGEKFFALESSFDPRFAESNFTGKFTQDQYFRQLVAANLRGDIDLHKGNLSGDILADVGTAGVFQKASGKQSMSTDLRSMAETAKINLLGEKVRGAQRFFAESTMDVPKNMTAEQYHNAMVAEIDRQLPLLEKVVNSFNLDPATKPFYEAMITRLREGRKVDWRSFHAIHKAVKPKDLAGKALVKKGESLQNTTTKAITPIVGTPKPANVTSSSGNPLDNILTTIPKGTRVVQTPRVVLPGFSGAGGPVPSNVADPFAVQKAQENQTKAINDATDATKKGTTATENATNAATEEGAARKTLGAKVTHASGIFAGLTILGSFMGGKIGEVSQTLVPFAIGLQILTQMMPSLKTGFMRLGTMLLANPWALALAGLVALVASIKLMKDRNNKQAKVQSEYIDAISATTEKMKKVGEVTGKVGASEIMARRREGGTSEKYTTQYDRAGQQFGTNFLSSDIGKSIYETFKTNVANGGKDAVKSIALELSAYVSDGLMTAEDAKSVARSIGINMSDMTIAANINGELTSLLGPDGQNLLTDPLNVRINIGKEQTKIASEALKSLQGADNIESQTELAASTSAAYTQSLEIIQAQRDAQAKMNADQVAALKTQLASTIDKKKQLDLEQQISDLEKKTNQDDAKFGAQKQQVIKDQLAAFKYTESKGGFLQLNQTQNAFMKSGQEQVRLKYKGTAQEAFINEFLQKSAATGGRRTSKIEVVLNTMVGGGDLTPLAATKLLDMFGKEGEAKLETLLTTTFATQDPGKVQELINIATGIKGKNGKEVGLTLLTKIGAAGQEAKFDDRLNALTLLQQMDGKEINLALFLDDKKGKDGKTGLERLDELVPLLNKVEAIKSPITKKIVEQFDTNNTDIDLKGLMKDWERYADLPDELKKTVIQTYISIYKTITDENAAGMAKEEAAKRGLRGRSAGAFVTKYGNKGSLSALLTKEQFAAANGTNVKPAGGGGGGGTKTDPYAFLSGAAQSVKNFRNSLIDAAKPLNALQQILSGKLKFDVFTGLSQKLANIKSTALKGGKGSGMSEGFMEALLGLDPASFAALNGKLYTIKKGVISLTPKGKAANKLFDLAALGESAGAMEKSTRQITNQVKSYDMLKKSGLDSATAMQIAGDAALASAIAGGRISTASKEWKQYKADIDRASAANKEFARTQMIDDLNRQIVAINNQKIAYDKLIAAGVSVARAEEVSTNEAQAFVVANESVDSAHWPELLDLINKTTKAIDGGTNALDDFIKKLTEDINFKKQFTEALPKLKEMGATLEDVQMILDNPDAAKALAEGLQKGTIDAKRLKEIIDLATKDRKINILFNMAVDPRAAINDKINDLTSGIDSQIAALDAQMTVIHDQFDPLIAGAQAAVDTAQASIDSINAMYDAQINAIQATIDEQQHSIAQMFDKPIQAFQDQIATLQKQMTDTIDKPIAALNEQISAIQHQIDIQFTRPLAALSEESNILSNNLTILNHQEQAINDKYDKQVEALEKVNKINQDISNQKKSQLTIADALSKGDIAGAAKAIQDLRAQEAASASTSAVDAMNAARKSEINGLTVNGMTKAQIEERQYQIQQQQFKLQQQQLAYDKQIQGLQDQIYTIEQGRKAIQDQIAAIEEKIALLDEQKKAALAIIADEEEQIYQLKKQQTAELVTANAELKNKQDALKAIEQQMQDQLKPLEDQKTKWQEIKDKLIAQQAELNKVPLTLEEAKTKAAELATEIANIGTAAANAAAEIAAMVAAIGAAQAAAASAVSSATSLASLQASADAAALAASQNLGNGADALYDQKAAADAQAALDAYLANQPKVYDPLDPTHKGSYQDGVSAVGPLGPVVLKAMGYWANGGLIPRGTDTVPAMLTPGEFVINRASTNKFRPILDKINKDDFKTGREFGRAHNFNGKHLGWDKDHNGDGSKPGDDGNPGTNTNTRTGSTRGGQARSWDPGFLGTVGDNGSGMPGSSSNGNILDASGGNSSLGSQNGGSTNTGTNTQQSSANLASQKALLEIDKQIEAVLKSILILEQQITNAVSIQAQMAKQQEAVYTKLPDLLSKFIAQLKIEKDFATAIYALLLKERAEYEAIFLKSIQINAQNKLHKDFLIYALDKITGYPKMFYWLDQMWLKLKDGINVQLDLSIKKFKELIDKNEFLYKAIEKELIDAIDKANTALQKVLGTMSEIAAKAQAALAAIQALNTTVTTTHYINTIYTTSGTPGGASTGGSVTNASNNGGGIAKLAASTGGIVPKYLAGGGNSSMFKSIGTDTIPAMLTPGEFVINASASKNNMDLLQRINSGNSISTSLRDSSEYSSQMPKFNRMTPPVHSLSGPSYSPADLPTQAMSGISRAATNSPTSISDNSAVYNYSVNVNVNGTQAGNPNDIANAVMQKIKEVEAQQIRRQVSK